MSSVQTSQLISLLVNNVLMIIIVAAVTLVAWLRWHWLRTEIHSIRAGRRRYRWAYVSFVLTSVTFLGMLVSLIMLALRSLIAVNALVAGAMGVFVLSVVTLLVAMGLWLWDLCLPVVVRRGNGASLRPPMVLLPATNSRRVARRTQRRYPVKSKG
ncbi:MAG: hypothetical protein ACFB2W_11095 [Leptolyngbyaceae cyanobacterium]